MGSFNNVPEFRYTSQLTPVNSILKLPIRSQNILTDSIRNSAESQIPPTETRDRFYNLNEVRLQKLENDYFNYKLMEIVTKPYEERRSLSRTIL